MSNIPAQVLRLAADRGDRVAFRMQLESGGYRSITWTKYRDSTLRFANYLRSQGVGPGDRVLLVSENCPEWTMVGLAAMSLGATLVPVAAIASGVELENIIRGSNPKFSVLSTRVAALKALSPGLLNKFFTLDSHEENPLEEITASFSADNYDESLCSSDSVAVLIYTSGTTGHPKAVPLTHKNILSNAEDILLAISASETDRCVSVLPLSHMLEFTGGFLLPALVGAPVTYVKSLRSDDLLEALKDTRATIFLGVPLLFEIMARSLETKIHSLPQWIQNLFKQFSVLVRKNRALGPLLFFPIHRALGGKIRFFVAGGSRLQPKVYDFFNSLGILVLQGYGLTETSPVLCLTTAATAGPDHVGKPLRSVEVGIFSDDGKRLGIGVEGEVWAKGPNIFSGYLDPAHNTGVFTDGWFRTGDLGTLDEQGLLRITGRKKDIIVSAAGKNIYPEEIEAAIAATNLFLEVAILGINDEAGHEKVCAAVVPDRVKFAKQFGAENPEDIAASAKRVVSEAAKILSDYKRPQRVEIFFEELPKTITRKVKKHEVRNLINKRAAGEIKREAGQPNQDAFLRMDDELECAVAEGISAITRLPIQEIARSASLSRDLALDSLLLVEVLSGVEKKFEHQFEGVDFSKVESVGDFVSVLGQALGDKKSFARRKVWLAEFNPADNARKRWRWPRSALNRILRIWLKHYYRLEVEGAEQLSEKESYVFTPNHSSHFDTFALMAAIPRSRIHSTYAIAAKDYFFGTWWTAFIARILINAIPFDRKARVDEGMQKCFAILARHESLLIFPEGTRSPDGKLQEFKLGVGHLLAAQKRVKAVPVYIEGAHDILPKGGFFPSVLGKLRIRFGTPVSFAQYPPTKDSFRAIAKDLQHRVEELSPRKG